MTATGIKGQAPQGIRNSGMGMSGRDDLCWVLEQRSAQAACLLPVTAGTEPMA